MARKKQLDYIIVGQGLAGSALAIKLLKQGKRILVVDQPGRNTSSRIAAGLFNPITGKKMVKTWMADKLFPALHTHYREAEALCGNTFFHPMALYRPFISYEEQNEWMGKSSTPDFSSYIRHVSPEQSIAGVNDKFGGLMLAQGGYLDTSGYIDALRQRLISTESYMEVDAQDITLLPNQEGVSLGDFEATRVVFCNGTHANKWFSWLPIGPLKGEAILVTANLHKELIINRGVYVVPAKGDWRVGATYNYNDQSMGTTEKSKAELGQRLRELITIPFEIIGQEWGFRPTTPDRRPMLGQHPESAAVWIFNGLGTKGVSLAPYFAEVLIRSMENGEPLNKEVDIERFKLLYWTSPK